MSKKLVAVLLAAAMSLTLIGCSGDSYAFNALPDTPAESAIVVGNGGTYVEKGDYSYFINAAEDGAGVNDFGIEHAGTIVRCLTDKLTSADRKVEVVVPKIIYAEDKASAGFYIFGSKIFYPTPNNVRDANGNVQSSKLDLMSANLDGTGTQKLATIDSVSSPFVFMQNGGKVFALFEGKSTIKVNGEDTQVTAIFSVDAQSGEQKKVAEDIDKYVFDRSEGGNSVAYTKTQRRKVVASGQESTESRYNVLYSYTVGDEEEKELVDGANDGTKPTLQTMTVQAASNGNVYYTYTRNYVSESGLAKVNVASGKTTKLSTKQYTSFLPFEENGADGIFAVDNGRIWKLFFKDGTVDATKSIRLAPAPSGTIEWQKDIGGYLYYSIEDEYLLYAVKDDKPLTENESVTVISGQMQSTVWAQFDFAERDGKVAVFYFNDIDSVKFANYLYMDIYTPAADEESDSSIASKRLGLLISSHQTSAENNGDDAGAVEKFAK